MLVDPIQIMERVLDNLKEYLNELSQIDDTVELLSNLITWLRPKDISALEETSLKVCKLAEAMEQNPELATTVRERLQNYALNLSFLALYCKTGVLPPRSFFAELKRRAYDKMMPKPAVVFGAKNLLDAIFDKKNDHEWVEALADETWIQLYQTLFPASPDSKVAIHLRNELLYGLEMLSIWLASEEMNDELLRLDPSTIDRDSNFIAQEREINMLILKFRQELIDDENDTDIDTSHAWVILEQCEEQIKNLHQLALTKGSDLKLTYLLERLGQMLARICKLLSILEKKDEDETLSENLSLFKELVREESKENSVLNLVRQTNYMLAKSVTNHAGRAGEHYVTQDGGEYLRMLCGGVGAGVIIAFMAYIKIYILSLGLPLEATTFWVSLNYGLGFIIIYMCHFTVATKQPAMTAAYIAKKLEGAQNGSVNINSLAQLMIDVGRSQFAAILGNVLGALPTAIAIGYVLNFILGGGLVSKELANELMQEQNPVTSLALFYAAIAGFWLFVSGVVAGFFQNRSLYLDLPGRIRQHPILRFILPNRLRLFFAGYIDRHYGALWGNFFFGVMLGLTAYVGYALAVPLDIRHVAFSMSNVGFSAMAFWPGAWAFLEFVMFALLIGIVNLSVSFILALNVAVRSRGIRLGNFGPIFKAYWKKALSRPLDLLIPPSKNNENAN